MQTHWNSALPWICIYQ